MTYNPDTFIEQLMAISSKKEQLDVLKAYMLRLPIAEIKK